MTDHPQSLGEEIRAAQKRQVRATVGLYVAIVVLLLIGWFAFLKPTHDALCSFKADLGDRVEQSKDLIAHPEDFPKQFTGPATLKLIRSNLPAQEQTLDALGVVRWCGS